MKFALFWAVMVCVLQTRNSEYCCNLPKVPLDVSLLDMEPSLKDNWKTTVSNQEADKCQWSQVFRYRNNNISQETVIISINDGKGHISVLFESNLQLDKWTTKSSVGEPTDSHKLLIDSKNEAYCVYSCSKSGKTIDALRCFTTNQKGEKSINAKLKNFGRKLVFTNNKKPKTTWTKDCGTLPLRPLGWRKSIPTICP